MTAATATTRDAPAGCRRGAARRRPSAPRRVVAGGAGRRGRDASDRGAGVSRRGATKRDVFEADLASLQSHPEFSLLPELATLGTAGRPNVVARMPGAGAGRSLFVFAHVDSYVLDPHSWSADPYRVTVDDDGRAIGFGIADDRSGIAGMVMAARAMAAAGVRPAGALTMASCLGKHLWCGGNPRRDRSRVWG